MDKIHLDILITGNIRSIGFAFQSMRVAEKLNICGFTQYTGINSAKIEAEGTKDSLFKFVDWCKTGLPEAGKLDVKVASNLHVDFDNFIIFDIQK